MPIRITQVPQNNTTGETDDPIAYETEYDGQKFTWAPGQMRSIDTAQAIGHIAGEVDGAPAAGVVQDNASSGKKYPNQDSRI